VRALKTMLSVFLLTFFMIGCLDSDTSTDKQTDIVSTENQIKTVTKEQLKKISPQMTYEKAIGVLGDSKDIGSGRFIKQYQDKDGEQFTLNYGSPSDTLSGEEYKKIQSLITK
jgi:hypothetical protein